MNLQTMLATKSDDWVNYQICNIKEPEPILTMPVWNKENEKSCWRYTREYVPSVVPKLFCTNGNLTEILLNEISDSGKRVDVIQESSNGFIDVYLVDAKTNVRLIGIRITDRSQLKSICARMWLANKVIESWLL
jgi:hypothetical protein